MASSPYYELILLGEPGVGKTCLFARISEDTFIEDKERMTIGLDYTDKTVTINGEEVHVSLIARMQFAKILSNAL